MKYRNIAICLAPLILVGGFYLLQRSAQPKVSKTSIYEESDVETVAAESESNSGVAIDPLESTPIPSMTETRGLPSPGGSNGNLIPFESLAMGELEEVDLTGSGEVHSHKMREWRGQLEPSLRDIKDLLKSEGEEGVLAISLPDATQVKVTRMRYQSFGSNQGVLSGKILGDPFGEVVLSYVNQAVAGSIRDYRNDMVWEIRNAGEGRQFIAQVDVDALGVCGVCAEHGGVE